MGEVTDAMADAMRDDATTRSGAGGQSAAILAAVGARDPEALEAALQGARVTMTSLGRERLDPQQARDQFAQLVTAVPDLELQVVRTYPGEAMSAAEVVLSGTFSAPLAGTPATGRAAQVYARFVVSDKPAGPTDVTITFDLDAALDQLGLRLATGGAGLLNVALADQAWWVDGRALAGHVEPAPPPRRRRALLAAAALAVVAVAAGTTWALRPSADAGAAPTQAPTVPTGRPTAGPSASPTASSTLTTKPAAATTPTPSATVANPTDTAPLQSKQPVRLDSTLLFALDSATLRPAAGPALANLARRIVAADRAGTVTVVGYTDDLGTTAHALELSRARADAVARELRGRLAGRPLQIRAQGAGKARPVVPNTNESNRAQNRRVEVTFTTR